jgi:hypothetical protein
MKIRRLHALFLALPLIWILTAISAIANVQLGDISPISSQALPEPILILLAGLVLLLVASGFRSVIGKKPGSL